MTINSTDPYLFKTFCGLSIISQLFKKNFAFELSENECVDEFVSTIAVTGDLDRLQTEYATLFEGRYCRKTFLHVFVENLRWLRGNISMELWKKYLIRWRLSLSRLLLGF